jgi:hypothetical protein
VDEFGGRLFIAGRRAAPAGGGRDLMKVAPMSVVMRVMTRVTTSFLILLAAAPATAQDPQSSMGASIGKAARESAAQETSGRRHGPMFWSGLAIGVAGATTAVLGATVYRVEDSSTGNAPASSYQACIAQKRDPVYAANACSALKGKNRPLIWSGVAMGALGTALMIGGSHTSAEIGPGGVRLLHSIRF